MRNSLWRTCWAAEENALDRDIRNKNLKIVHIGLDIVPSSGGSVVAIRDFSRAAESKIISFTNPTKLKAEDSAIPGAVHIETSPGFFGRAFAWAPEFNRQRAEEAINGADLMVCHILLRYHVHWVKAIARRKNIPYWVVLHGCLDPYVFSYRSLSKKTWFHLFGRPFLKKAAYVIFATEKEKLKARTYYDGTNCRVIHWPVQAIDTTRRDYARNLIRSKHQIMPDEKIIIYLGRLHSLKRPLETITAFAKAEVSGTHLLIVGPEETISQKDCIILAKKLGIKNVHLTGPFYGEEKNDYLLASDVYISLSHRENFGYTVAEALSAGLPVILSPGNDLADELKSLKCGWMLCDNSLETASAAIKEFSALSIDQLVEMSRRGRNWALKELDFNRFAEQIKQLAADTVRKL